MSMFFEAQNDANLQMMLSIKLCYTIYRVVKPESYNGYNFYPNLRICLGAMPNTSHFFKLDA